MSVCVRKMSVKPIETFCPLSIHVFNLVFYVDAYQKLVENIITANFFSRSRMGTYT